MNSTTIVYGKIASVELLPNISNTQMFRVHFECGACHVTSANLLEQEVDVGGLVGFDTHGNVWSYHSSK